MTLQSENAPEPDRRAQAGRVVRLVAAFYAATAALGLGLILWRRDALLMEAPLAPPGPDWPAPALVALGLLLGAHLLARLGYRLLPSFRRGADALIRPLGALTFAQTAFVSLASGIGEELLFRGYLLNETGLWVSSLAFGLVHWPPNRNFVHWPFFAAVMGLALGWLYQGTGSLLYPVFLHAGINFLNLRMALTSRERREGTGGSGTPSEASDREGLE